MGGRARRRIARESMEFAKEQVAAYRAEQVIQRDILEKLSLLTLIETCKITMKTWKMSLKI